MTDILNLEALTFDAYLKLQRLDKTLVRTPDYIGLAYFWHHDFRFHLTLCEIEHGRTKG